jgi:uncharacterized protein YcbX
MQSPAIETANSRTMSTRQPDAVSPAAFRAAHEEPLGVLERIWRYPVKALAGVACTSCRVDADGLAGDRTAALMVRDGHARVGKAYRGKEEPRMHLFASANDAIAQAATTGVALEQARGERFFDARPISLIVDAWLREVERFAGRAVDPLRFRPNFYVRGTSDMRSDEADLVGATLAIGAVVLRVVEPIHRCVTPSYDVATAEADPAMQRAYALDRGNIVGIYCEVGVPGDVAVGDAVVRRLQ